jgi:hypothetical protein
MLRDTGYGVTFVLKKDPEGKLKREPFDITPLDAEKIALKNLFEAAGLEYDPKKSSEVLRSEYQIFMNASKGTDIKASGPLNVEHRPVDLNQQRLDLIKAAKDAYKDKYGEEVPAEFSEDVAFLSALSDPNFDAKAYINRVPENTTPVEEPSEEPAIEDLRAEYHEKYGVHVANPKKNDAAWIKSKLAEKKE